jgi:hypothetical protein
MTAIIIQFPRPYRHRPPERCPFDRVRVMPCGDYGEVLVVANAQGWLHGSWASAVDDAVELAADYGLAVSLDQ